MTTTMQIYDKEVQSLNNYESTTKISINMSGLNTLC